MVAAIYLQQFSEQSPSIKRVPSVYLLPDELAFEKLQICSSPDFIRSPKLFSQFLS